MLDTTQISASEIVPKKKISCISASQSQKLHFVITEVISSEILKFSTTTAAVVV